MTRRLKTAEHRSPDPRVYVANVGYVGGDPHKPDLAARIQFSDETGRVHTVTFPAHLLEHMANEVELARRAFAVRAPEELIHPMQRNRLAAQA